MKQFLKVLTLVILTSACGPSQGITKTEGTTSQDKKASAVAVAEKIIDTVVKTPINDSLMVAPMKKHAPPAPQIMKLPESTVPIIADEKAPEIENLAPKTVKKPTVTTIDHTPWDKLLQKHVTADGKVNYQGFKGDRTAFRAYLKTLSTTVPQETWSINQRFAYWMNAYNAFTVKLIVDNYPIKSIKDIEKPWDLRFFQIGKKWYNLNEIEHQILRKMNDPRIHFGINCASFSCPPLLNKAFTAANVNEELDKLAIAFINDKKRNEISPDTIKISKIFQWFGKDFKKNGSLIDFLNQYADTAINANAKQRFLDYNWNLNE